MNSKIKNFEALTAFLTENAIDYALLGRKQSLNEIIEGDIDIVVSKTKFKGIEGSIEAFCQENNMLFIQNFQHESSAKYMIISDKKDHTIICPDICCDFVRDARLLIKDEHLLNNTILLEVEGLKFRVLNPENEFFYYFLKKIDKKKLGVREFEHLLEQFELSQKEALNSVLSHVFSVKSSKKITEIFNTKNLETLSNSVDAFRQELHKNKPIKARFFIKDKVLKVKRVINKTGLSIAIMGSDGSGKSTIIKGITQSLKPAFRNVQYYHLKPIDKNLKPSTSNPHEQNPYSFFKSLTKLVYLVYQYNKGFVNVWKQMVKSKLVIFDRYYDDILVDRLRFRYGAPIWIAKLFSLFIPKPQLYFLLDAPGELIFERKKELSIQEIDRQREQYLKIFKNKKNHFIIDASQPSEKAIFDIEEKILTYLNHRQNRRNAL